MPLRTHGDHTPIRPLPVALGEWRCHLACRPSRWNYPDAVVVAVQLRKITESAVEHGDYRGASGNHEPQSR